MNRIALVDAFVQTLKAFRAEKITGKWLSERSKIRPTTISQYKNKKQDVTTATLDTLLKSLPPSAYLYFCSRLIESEMTGADPVKMELLSKTLLITQLRAFISQCNEKDLLELFGALYEGYRERLAELEEVDDDQIS